MSNKILNARFQHKIDTYDNWSKATNFIPLKGELIIYTTDKTGKEQIGFKIGTGEQDKNVHQLDFVSFSEAAAVAEGGIRYDLDQNLTEEEKKQGRINIDATSVQFVIWEDND